MKKKLYLLIILLIIIFIPILLFIIDKQRTESKDLHITQTINNSTEKTQQAAKIETFSSPNTSESVTHGEILYESTADGTTQKFLVKNWIDGKLRTLYTTTNSHIKFEKMTAQNWSPTNRFFFVYIDTPTKRDLLFFKMDGTFTNGQYYLHSVGLYPDATFKNAQWTDVSTLDIQAEDIKTHQPQKYTANFDDDSGIVSPVTK